MKSEIRKLKYQISTKDGGIQKVKSQILIFRFSPLRFGFFSDFGFRISGIGFLSDFEIRPEASGSDFAPI